MNVKSIPRTVQLVPLLPLLSSLLMAFSGCYDPTANSVDAGSASVNEVKTLEVGINDVAIKLNGENTDIKWTGSNSAGQSPYGYFYELEGLLLLDKSADEIRHLEITIEMEGVKAMDQSLTEKLKKKGFFQIDQFPESKFIATEIRRESREGDPEGTTHVIVGNFQLRDVTRSISFPANIAVEESKLRLTSEFKINRKDYGVVYSDATGDALIRDNVLINIDIETTVN